MSSIIALGSIWNLKSTKKREKNANEYYFLMFDSTVEIIKENKI